MQSTAHRLARSARADRQRGMVTLVAMLFLIATVVFALSQMLDISTGNVIDGQRQGDSTSAFFLAESGVDKAQAIVNGALAVDSYTDTTCTGLANAYSNVKLGRGSFSLSGVSPSTPCSGSACQLCKVTSVGQVGVTKRTVTQDLVFNPVSGVFCNGAVSDCRNTPTVTWELKLKNTAAIAGLGLFNLTYNTQGNNSATCAAASNCSLQLNLNSPSNGAPSTGLMGNAVVIPANTTYPIYQTLTKPMVPTGGLAEVGVLFYGTTAPTLTGPNANPGAAAYWGDSHQAATSTTVGKNSSTGGTNDGAAPIGSPACSSPSTSVQACTSWCYGGDTLVFSFAGNVTLLTDQLSYVKFGTNANVGQNILLTQMAKYPSSAVSGAPKPVDAEIWYARNPNLGGGAGSPLATGVSSWKGRGTASIGANWTSNSSDTTAIANPGGVPTLTVGNSFTGYPNQIISVGDTVTNSGGGGAAPTCTTNCGTIVSQLTSAEAGGALGGRGTYRLSGTQTVNAANNRVWTINSNVLNVTACTTCFVASGDAVALGALSAGRTINAAQSTPVNTYGRTEAAGGLGRYPISGTATQIASVNTLKVGTPGTTLYLPSGQPQPAVTTPAMLLTVKSAAASGVMAPGTTVQAVGTGNAATSTFTVSTAPTTNLDAATICAGTCAFFVPGTNTTYSLGMTSNFNEWASGFVCMKGVDQPPQAVTSSSAFSKRWTELVQ